MTTQLRKDGKYTIYIIQFKYVDALDVSWHNAGSCDQFLPQNLTRKQWDNIVFNKPFRSLHSCGDCWQKTGIEGSFDSNDAVNAMVKISQLNPGRTFRVARLEIDQKTSEVALARNL
jgi:hypothetical protein